jgi:DNA-binding NarL/FixJ family response regulator
VVSSFVSVDALRTKGRSDMQSIAENEIGLLLPREEILTRVDQMAVGLRYLDPADVWRGLVNGRHFLQSSVCTDTRCFATLHLRPPFPRAPRASDSKIQVLEKLLLGFSQKQLAIETGRSVSSVCSSASDCLQAFGYAKPSRLPIMLVMAAHAANGLSLGPARLVSFDASQGGRWLLSMPRPDIYLQERLSTAEWLVARMLVEGRSYAEMARLREISIRTVANQLSAVFHKLGVSGRVEFLVKIVREEANLH